MASLIDELLEVLQDEKNGYENLLSFEDDKRKSIIDGDIESLDQFTSRENEVTSELKNLENKRLRILRDMSVVLGKEGEEMTVTSTIAMLDKQPKEQQQLTEARDALVEAASRMQLSNQQNEILLKQALEMVEFDLTLFKSLKQAPETANYDRNAYNTGELLGRGSFDASQ